MKKKLVVLILISFFFIPCVNAEDLVPNAKSAILIEESTGKILYEKNSDEKRAPASMTKVMSMLLIMEALDNKQISLNDEVTISQNAADMGGSQLFLQPNQTAKVEDLLKGIAVASGNDAVVAMAEKIAGSEEKFVDMMNKKAKELGLKNTQFKNPHGLDEEGHYTSAHDMAIMAKELIKHKNILNYTSIYEEYLTKSDGTKFGKTNGKAIWLDREKTSPYEMYQFFINSEDDKVIDYLKFLTFLIPEEIMELEEKNKTQPHLREAHKALAREVITFLHGEGAYEEAVQVSQTLFSGQIQNLTLEQVDVAFEGVPTVETEENEMNILDALILVGAAKSKREAREFVNGGSVLINGERIKDLEFTVKKEDAFGQSKTVIRRGKKNYFVLKYNG